MALAQMDAQIVCQIFAAACVRQVCAEAASCRASSAFKMLFMKNWGRRRYKRRMWLFS